MIADFHMHTEFSEDSATPMERQIERAMELGVKEICFTDHVDYGIINDWDEEVEYTEDDGRLMVRANVPYEEYLLKIARMRKTYAGKITIRAGLELGVQAHTVERYERLMDMYWNVLDFCLLSIHEVADCEFWTQDWQKGRTQDEYNLGYYQALLDVVSTYKRYDVLSHLDHIVRYDLAGPYPFEKIEPLVAQVFEAIIPEGKGIEINTSSWHYGLPDTTPSRDILALYREMGGEILTMGSDAHTPEYLADHFDEARGILKSIGFERFYTFEHHEPVPHRL